MDALPSPRLPRRLPVLQLLLAALLLCSAPALTAREFTDMAGRRVSIPDNPARVFPAVTTLTPVLAALTPERLVALSFELTPGSLDYLHPHLAKLPVVKVLENLEGETMLTTRTDLVLGWHGPGALTARTETLTRRLGKPLLLFEGERLEQYPAVFRQLGQVLGQQARAETLARDLEQRQAHLATLTAAIPAARRLRVYYAESPDGLSSQCHDSSRLEVIRLAGGLPALNCQGGSFATSQTLDFERVLQLDPDVILARDAAIARRLAADPRWQMLRAVRAGRVFGAPTLPFNWFDRPPSFLRALGALWLASQLYPNQVQVDIRAEARRFNTLYFGVRPNDAALDRMLAP